MFYTKLAVLTRTRDEGGSLRHTPKRQYKEVRIFEKKVRTCIVQFTLFRCLRSETLLTNDITQRSPLALQRVFMVLHYADIVVCVDEKAAG
jgi:hypothetical protein